jgi:hypothetical protein
MFGDPGSPLARALVAGVAFVMMAAASGEARAQAVKDFVPDSLGDKGTPNGFGTYGWLTTDNNGLLDLYFEGPGFSAHTPFEVIADANSVDGRSLHLKGNSASFMMSFQPVAGGCSGSANTVTVDVFEGNTSSTITAYDAQFQPIAGSTITTAAGWGQYVFTGGKIAGLGITVGDANETFLDDVYVECE